LDSNTHNRSIYGNFILLFVAIKIGLNLLAISHFGFQRDEFLHLALGDHLDWGFKEVPPFIALLAKISTSVFGDSVFATRIFSTIAGGLIIWFTGKIVVEFGGRKFAIALACLALIFSPAFAASDYLFLKVDRKFVKVLVNDILYIESLKDYVRVKTPSQALISYQSLTEITDKLPSGRFVRVHRSYTIAIDKVSMIDGNCVEVDGKLIPISREHRQEVMEKIYK